MKQLSLQSSDLSIDWIAFSFSRWHVTDKDQITQDLAAHGFSVYRQSDNIKNPVIVHDYNCSAIFTNYRKSTVLSFSGSSADCFYQKISDHTFPLYLLSASKLSRLDIRYQRITTPYEPKEIEAFFKDCETHLKIKQKNPTYARENNKNGPIFTIGSRRSPHFLRIYASQPFLIFEYEMKYKALQSFQRLLFESQLDEFEHKLVHQFLHRFGNILPLEKHIFVDWLLVRLRPLRNIDVVGDTVLRIDYLENIDGCFPTFQNQSNFIRFLQFLSFTHSLDYEIESLGSTNYRNIIFPLKHFFRAQKFNPEVLTITSYQRDKIRRFFNDLQSNSFLEAYSNNHYRALVTIPKVEMYKSPSKIWMVQIWVAEELFDYVHPFLFPDLFQAHKLNKYEYSVLYSIIATFTGTVSLEKTLEIDHFLSNQFHITNQKKTTIKKYFIKYIQKLQQRSLIQDYVLVQNNAQKHPDHLQTQDLARRVTIYEFLKLKE